MAIHPLVCIVDDQDDYRFLLQQVFRRYLSDYSTRFFSNGRDLIEKLPELDPPPRLVILDRHMPVLDGYQTLVHLKGNPASKKIPVVMMSHDASNDGLDCCYEVGVNSFIRKEIDFDSTKRVLINVCKYWLEVNKVPDGT
jgi:CheY-like chemotaxis protein